jgi:hypothetical protein
MSHEDLRARIADILKQAEILVDGLRVALAACDQNDGEMKRTLFPWQRQSVAYEIEAAINAMPQGRVFGLRDVFERFQNKELDYEKSRPSISIRLAALVREGRIEKIKRGEFKKPKEMTRKK